MTGGVNLVKGSAEAYLAGVRAALAVAAPVSAAPVASDYYPGLWQDGERQIEDIRPVDANGVPLAGVYLFDQDGRSIDTDPGCSDGIGDPAAAQRTESYPRGTWEFDERAGECVLVPPGPLVVAVPTGAAAPSEPAEPTPVEPAPTSVPGSLVGPEPETQAPPTG